MNGITQECNLRGAGYFCAPSEPVLSRGLGRKREHPILSWRDYESQRIAVKKRESLRSVKSTFSRQPELREHSYRRLRGRIKPWNHSPERTVETQRSHPRHLCRKQLRTLCREILSFTSEKHFSKWDKETLEMQLARSVLSTKVSPTQSTLAPLQHPAASRATNLNNTTPH